MKFDNAIQKAILRLKAPDNQRMTSNLREAAELAATYLAELACGVEALPGGYKATTLQSELGPRVYLTKGQGTNRVAFIADIRPLWDAESAVQTANTEHMRLFVKEISHGLVEAIGEHMGKVYAERLREVAKLLGKANGTNPPLRRATDWEASHA